MLYEYAVEPEAIGESWDRFRSLIGLFGFERGRLISRFPNAWERKVIEAAKQSRIRDVDLKRLVNKLERAKREAFIRSSRSYEPSAGDWLDNAIQQHALKPFHAIIASKNRGGKDFILEADSLVDDEPLLMVASSSREVPRTAKELADAMSLLLRTAKEVLFIDRYFDLRNDRYTETLKEFLSVISASGLTNMNCEIHYHDDPKMPSVSFIEQYAGNWLAGVIPEGKSIKVYAWQEKEKGADFHARFLLTNLGGISVDAGFSAEGSHQKVLLTLLNPELCREKLAMFRHDSTDYELIEPVLKISSNGEVRRL